MIWFQPSVGMAGFTLKMVMTPPSPSGQADGACTPPGATGPLDVSYAPVELGDLTATTAQVLGLDGAGDVRGRSRCAP